MSLPPPPLPSSFETLIQDLFQNAAPMEDAPKPAHPFSIGSLEAAWELAAQARRGPGDDIPAQASPYGYDPGEAAREISLDPNRIVSELGLHAGVSDADIVALRRQFAMRNHPDRVPAELRDIATQRMMIANDLIDRYVASLKNARGRSIKT